MRKSYGSVSIDVKSVVSWLELPVILCQPLDYTSYCLTFAMLIGTVVTCT